MIARGGNDTCTPSDLHNTLLQGGGVNSTTATLGRTNRSLQSLLKPSAFSGMALSNMAHRQYIWTDSELGPRLLESMTLRRSTNTGVGKVLPAKRLANYWHKDTGPQRCTTIAAVVAGAAHSGVSIVSTAGAKKEQEAAKEAKRAAVSGKRQAAALSKLAAAEKEQPANKQRGRKQTFYCQHKGCTRYFNTSVWLQNHMDKGDHTAGIRHLRKGKQILETDGISMAETMKRLVTENGGFAESFQPIQLKSERCGITLLQSAETQLLSGAQVARAGADVFLSYAVKPKRGVGSVRFTPSQLAFLKLKWGYSLGEINKNNKMTANVGAEVVPLVGTMAGEVKLTPPVGAVDPYMKANTDGIATFRMKELLDVWRIKPWFSQQKQASNKKLEAAAKAAAEFVAGAGGEGSLEVDDVDLDEQVVDEDE